MESILIVSYYFPPCNGTPAPRPFSWAQKFSERGYNVNVVSRHWTLSGNEWGDYISDTEINQPTEDVQGSFKIWWLPYKKYKYSSFSFFNKLKTLHNLLSGELEKEVDTMQFYPFLKEHLSKNKYDALIVTAPPWNIVKLGSILSDEYNIPLIVDFRDFENDMVLNKNPQPTFSRQLEFWIDRYYMLKWCKKASLICSASKPLGEYVTENTGVPNIEILNGYTFGVDNINEIPPKNKVFSISILGYLFPAQNIDIFLDGAMSFIETFETPNVKFNFIGQKAIPKIQHKIEAKIPKQYLNITDRVSPEAAYNIGEESTILFYAGWENWVGVYSAKIFTYLGLKKNILIAPGDNDVIDKLIQETNSGEVLCKSSEVAEYLKLKYVEWLQTGKLKYEGNISEIEKYSRSAQANKFLSEIEKNIFVKTQEELTAI
ncbi:MAG: hypothetical protein V3V00_04260 [Saprospiraceae bacterium]